MKANYGELKEDIDEMKKRISALERAFDVITARDDIQAIQEAREDLKKGRTVSLAQAKKSVGV